MPMYRAFLLLVRVALTCRVETRVKLSEFLLAGRLSYVGCDLALIGQRTVIHRTSTGTVG